MSLKNAIDRDGECDRCCSSRWCVLHSRESLVILHVMTRGSAHQSFETLIHLSFEALSLSLFSHGFHKGITRPHSLFEEEHECANF